MSQLDYCIIGGGLSGVSAAYWLNQHQPKAKVLLIEKKQLAESASGRNAGFLTCGSINFYASLVNRFGIESATKIWKFCEENLRLVKEHIVAGHEEELEYSPCGSYSLFKDENALMRSETVVELMTSQGLEVKGCSREDIDQKLHLLHFRGGAYFEKDASIDPKRLTEAIFRSSQCEFLNDEVAVIEPTSPDGWRLRMRKEVVKTKNIIVAMNAFSYLLFPELKPLMRPVRAQILETLPTSFDLPANVYACDDLAYFRKTKNNTIVLGGLRHIDSESEETDQAELNTLIQEGLVQKMKEYFPVPLKVKRQWAGIMGFSPDHLPHIGQIQSSPGIYFLGGYSGHGMGMAFHTARCLADWIVKGEASHPFLLRAQMDGRSES